MSDPIFFKVREAAKFLHISVSALNAWRVRSSEGPKFLRFGRLVFYEKSELIRWALSRQCSSTSTRTAEVR